LDDVDSRFAGVTPKLDTVSPYRLYHCCIDEQFVWEGEAGSFADEAVEFCCFEIHLFAFLEDVWTLGEFAILGNPEVCVLICLLNVGFVDVYRGTSAFSERESGLCGFGTVDFDFPFVRQLLNEMNVFLQVG
jgi:hypothetical protein